MILCCYLVSDAQIISRPFPNQTEFEIVLVHSPLIYVTYHLYLRRSRGRDCGIIRISLMSKKDYQTYAAPPFRAAFAALFRCLIPRCGDMQGPGFKRVDGDGMICNVMHHGNRWECLLGL